MKSSSAEATEPRRRAFLLAGCAAGVGLTSGCAPAAPVRIGFLGGMTGRMSDLGIGGRNGAQLAVDDVNAAGGLMGRKLELLTLDDGQDDGLARKRLGELVEAKAAFVVGPMTSNMATAVLPLANRLGMPMISPLAGANSLGRRDDVFFRVVSDSWASAQQTGTALANRGLKRLVTVADLKNQVFTKNWTGSATQAFAAGGGRLAEAIDVEFAPGLRFADLAQRIVAAKGDAVVIAASATDSAVLVQQIRRLDEQVFIALSVWAGTEELPNLGGHALEGVMVTQFFDRFSASPAYLAFVQRYKGRFGDLPGYQALNGYDATTMGVVAYRAGGSAGSAAMVVALQQVRSMDGLQRKLTFNEFGDCLAPTYLTEIRQGQYAALQG